MRVEDGGKANRWAKDSIALQGDTIKGQMFRESGTSLLITGKAWCLSPLSWLIGADFKGGLSPSSNPTEQALTFFFLSAATPATEPAPTTLQGTNGVSIPLAITY